MKALHESPLIVRVVSSMSQVPPGLDPGSLPRFRVSRPGCKWNLPGPETGSQEWYDTSEQ